MSSVASAAALARRASAAVADDSAETALRVGFSPLHHGEHAGHEGQDEQCGGSGQHHAEPSDQHALRAVALGEVPFLARPGSARPASRKSRSTGLRVAAEPVPPLQGSFEPDAAVELAVRPPQAVPGIRGPRQVVQQPLALDVVVQPATQPWPGPGQRLVRHLDGAVVAGDQPRTDQHLDQPLLLGVGGDHPSGHPDADRLTLLPRRDEPQHQVAQQLTTPEPHLGVQALGGLGDRPVDAAGSSVRRRPSACCPHAASRSRAARGTAGAGRPGRPRPRVRGGPPVLARWRARPAEPALDRLLQPLVVQGSDEVETVLHDAAEPRVTGDVGEAVGPDGQGHGPQRRLGPQGGHERLALVLVVTQAEQSSNWSTSNAVPGDDVPSTASAAIGWGPGVISHHGLPRLRRAAATPAREQARLPGAARADQASNRRAWRIPRHASRSSSRPK